MRGRRYGGDCGDHGQPGLQEDGTEADAAGGAEEVVRAGAGGEAGGGHQHMAGIQHQGGTGHAPLPRHQAGY